VFAIADTRGTGDRYLPIDRSVRSQSSTYSVYELRRQRSDVFWTSRFDRKLLAERSDFRTGRRALTTSKSDRLGFGRILSPFPLGERPIALPARIPLSASSSLCNIIALRYAWSLRVMTYRRLLSRRDYSEAFVVELVLAQCRSSATFRIFNPFLTRLSVETFPSFCHLP